MFRHVMYLRTANSHVNSVYMLGAGNVLKKLRSNERWNIFIVSRSNTVMGYKYISFWTLPS